jgi:hypothetical protein
LNLYKKVNLNWRTEIRGELVPKTLEKTVGRDKILNVGFWMLDGENGE